MKAFYAITVVAPPIVVDGKAEDFYRALAPRIRLELERLKKLRDGDVFEHRIESGESGRPHLHAIFSSDADIETLDWQEAIPPLGHVRVMVKPMTKGGAQ